MILGGNGKTRSAHIVIRVWEWEKVEADPVATCLGDGKSVPRSFRENSGCLVRWKIK